MWPAVCLVGDRAHRSGEGSGSKFRYFHPSHGDTQMTKNIRKGFTLIELLIVVVIIGILAAIAIPKFANTKTKAYTAAMKSDLRNLVTAEESYFSDSTKYVTYDTTKLKFKP